MKEDESDTFMKCMGMHVTNFRLDAKEWISILSDVNKFRLDAKEWDFMICNMSYSCIAVCE